VTGCGDDEETPEPTADTGRPGDAGGDGALDTASDGTVDDELPPGEARWTRPDGYAAIRFVVDDTANQTYENAQMEWNGSFIWDSETGIIEFSASWLPTDGPFPPLYDDGPYTEGGHEGTDAVAGDHVFEVEVFFDAPDDSGTVFEYGLINELDHWIWEGPNGTVTVPAGETGTVVAPGMAFERFGDIDMRVTLDTASLNSEFTFDPASDTISIKGSIISWKPVQLLDNGERGDAAQDDGIFTFTLSESLGEHDGLLALEREAQFVFVVSGVEYKLAGDALTDGVAAFSTWDDTQPGVFLEEELLLVSESRGQALNTAIIVGPDEPLPTDDPVLRFVDPNRGPTTGGTPVQLRGEKFATGAVITFGDTTADCDVQSEELITCTTPARDRAGTVPVTVTNPDGKSDTFELGFTYVDVASAPRIDAVDPSTGSESGGDEVSVTGANFEDGATVLFGDEQATNVRFQNAGAILVDTPAGAPGPVDVTVRNPDAQAGTLANGFTYLKEGIDWASIQWPVSTIAVFADDPLPALYGRVYESGVTEGVGVVAGVIEAQLLVGPDGQDPREDFTGWTAYDMSYNGDLGNDDEYIYPWPGPDPAADPDITLSDPGQYDWLVRFRFVGDDDSGWIYGGYDGVLGTYADEAVGDIVVTEIEGLLVTDVSPRAISIVGAAEVTVDGFNFADGITVETRRSGSDSWSAQDHTRVSDKEITLHFADPGAGNTRETGTYDLRLDDGEDELVIANAFMVGYVASPEVDGEIVESASDWLLDFQHAFTDRESDWGDNVLYSLYAAFDGAGLYIAVEADVERSGNTLLIYVDTDYGSETGFARMSAIADEDTDRPATDWRLDRAITSQVDASGLEGFGADWAFGTMETEPEFADHYINELTGWRKLVAGDMWWYDIEAVCSLDTTCVAGTVGSDGLPGVVETFVSWDTLYGEDGLPDGGEQIALFARIVNRTGDHISNQSLPEDPAWVPPVEPETFSPTAWLVSEVVVIDVR
jgi:hypothetical protein